MTTVFDSELLLRGCKELGVDLSPAQIEKLIRYCVLLDERNQEFNLTGIPAEKFVTHHLLDSFSIARAVPLSGAKTLADVGTGAGLPGVPLAIAYPELRITLIDSTRKKLKFIDEVLDRLEIKNAVTVHARAEALASDPRYCGAFDYVLARAVAPLEKLAGWILPLTARSGVAIAYKGPTAREEFLQMQTTMKNATISVELHPVTVPELHAERMIVLIRKNNLQR